MCDTIKQIFNFIKNYYIIIITILMIIFLSLYMQQCRSKKDYETIANQNISAILDSLRTERNKNGELVYVNTAYSAETKDLQKLNNELYQNLAKEKQQNYILYGKLQNSFNSSSTITLTNTITEYPNNLFTMGWIHEKDTTGFKQELESETSFRIDTNKKDSSEARSFRVIDYGTEITKNSMMFDVYMGVRKNEETGKIEVTARTPNPDITLIPNVNIDQSIITQKQDNYIVSIGGGLGYGTSLDGKNGVFGWHTDLIHLGYRLFSW